MKVPVRNKYSTNTIENSIHSNKNSLKSMIKVNSDNVKNPIKIRLNIYCLGDDDEKFNSRIKHLDKFHTII